MSNLPTQSNQSFNQLEQPVAPIEFVHRLFCCDLGDLICEQLTDKKTTSPDLLMAFNLYGLGGEFVLDGAKNGGLISHELNTEIENSLIQIINLMARLGYKF